MAKIGRRKLIAISGIIGLWLISLALNDEKHLILNERSSFRSLLGHDPPNLNRPCRLEYSVMECGRSLVCNAPSSDVEGVCTYCSRDDQCSTTSLVCKEVSYENGKICTHKALFPNFDRTDAITCILAFISAVVASAGGIGGGGLFVPAFFLVSQFPLLTAIPLSKTAIFGTSIAAYMVNYRRRTKDGRRTLIDYDAALLLEPMVLAGTIIGVWLNLVSPNWLIIFALTLVLVITSYRTIKRAFQTYRAEKHLRYVDKYTARLETRARATDSILLRAGEASDLDSDDEEYRPTSSIDTRVRLGVPENHGKMKSSPAPVSDGSSVERRVVKDELGEEQVGGLSSELPQPILLQPALTPADQQQTLMQVLKEESVATSRQVIGLAMVWLVIILVAVTRGSRTAPSVLGLHPCRWEYWVIGFAAIPICVVFTGVVGSRLRRKFKDKMRLGHKYEAGEIKWTKKHVILGPLGGFGAGALSGMLGIGGGMLKGPMLLELGCEATITSATSSFMILFTSSATTVQFMVLGMIQYDYALWFAVICMFGSFVGKVLVFYSLSDWTSFIIFAISAVLIVSCIGLVLTGSQDIAEEIGAGHDVAFGLERLCHK